MNMNDMTKEVGKMYIIKETQEWWDDSKDICVMYSEEECDGIISELNEEYNNTKALRDECESCIMDTCGEIVEEHFTLRNTCNRSSLKADRNGLYCEGNMSHTNANMISYYYVTEISIREKV